MQSGIVNKTILPLLGKDPIFWYNEPKYWPAILIFVNTWKGIGYGCLIYISAINGIDPTYYEAAELDGAGSVTKFINITLPMISPTTFMVIIMTIIGAFKSFANIYNLTKGGPARTTQIIILYIYQNAFREYKFGYAAAASVVLFVIILLLTVTQWAMRRRMVYAED